MKADFVFLGSDVDSLVAARMLAASGAKVVVLETEKFLGGWAAPFEFAPGWSVPSFEPDVSSFPAELAESLGLERFGFKSVATKDVPEGSSTLWYLDKKGGDRTETIGDVYEWLKATPMRDLLVQWAETEPFLTRIAARDLSGLNWWGVARSAVHLGMKERANLLELMRWLPMPVKDFLDDRMGRENAEIASGLALTGLESVPYGPMAPGTTASFLLRSALQTRKARSAGHLVPALERSARDAGVEFHLGVEVERLRTERDVQGGTRVVGVSTASLGAVEAGTVLSSLDPQHVFSKWLPPAQLSIRFQERLRRIRMQPHRTSVFLGVEGRVDPRLPLGQSARLALGWDALETSSNAMKYGDWPAAAPVEYRALPARDGAYVLRASVLYCPNDTQRPLEEQRQIATELALRPLDHWLPSVRSQIRATRAVVPSELSGLMGPRGSDPLGVDHALDQLLMRPTPELATWRTPIQGLWQIGAFSHPCGGVTGRSGAMVARILRKQA